MSNKNIITGNNNRPIAGNSNNQPTIKDNRIRDKHTFKNSCYWISGSAILLSIISLSANFIDNSIIVSDQSIVLIFIGILATFVVIGNYMQVKETENRFKEKLKNSDEYFTNRIDALEKKSNLIYEIIPPNDIETIKRTKEILHTFTNQPNKDTLINLFSTIGLIENKTIQDKYCVKTAQAINNSNLKLDNSFEKEILLSLANSINSTYGESVPQIFIDSIENIKTKGN